MEAHKFPIGHTNRMPHIISQTQDDSHDELRDKPYPVEKTNFCKVKSNFGLAWKNQSSLVTVKSHLRTMPRSKKKKGYSKHRTSDIKHIRTMDVASFREISRIQRLENETLKTIKASSRKDSQTKEIWSGFWSKAAKMEIKKKRKPIGAIQSKARVNKKKKGQVAKQTENDDIPIARLLHTDPTSKRGGVEESKVEVPEYE